MWRSIKVKKNTFFSFFWLRIPMIPFKRRGFSSGAALHEYSTGGPRLLRAGWADLCGGWVGWQGVGPWESALLVKKLGKWWFNHQPMTISWDFMMISWWFNGDFPVCSYGKWFLEMIFHDLSTKTMVLFHSYVYQRVLSEVVLDTYEAYDIAEKKWLPPQRLGANGIEFAREWQRYVGQDIIYEVDIYIMYTNK